jgi:hypothetical protein
LVQDLFRGEVVHLLHDVVGVVHHVAAWDEAEPLVGEVVAPT